MSSDDRSPQESRQNEGVGKGEGNTSGPTTLRSLEDSGSENSERDKTQFYIGSDAEDDDGEWITVRRGRSGQGKRTRDPEPGPSTSRPTPPKARRLEEDQLDHEWTCESQTEVAQWVNQLQVMEEKIMQREGNLRKFRGLLNEARKYAVDFRNPVEWHEEMLAEFPWKSRHSRAMTDRQIVTSVQPEKLTQRLMTVTRRAVFVEQATRHLERERSALFASVEGRCLEKAESILEEYSVCLTHAPTRWALLREIIRRDGVTPAIARVNHRLETIGLRLDFHFAPTRPSFGLPSSSIPSTQEHWWRVPETGTIDISSDSDEDEATSPAVPDLVLGPVAPYQWKKRAAAEKVSTAPEETATARTQRLVSGHHLTLPLLTAGGRHRIWQRWTQELPRALPFGEEVLSELPASYRLEGGTLFVHLHLPLLHQAFHLYHLQDFPVSGPLGKPVFLRSDDARTLAVSEDARTYALLDPEDLQGLPYRRACLPLYATVCQESLHHFVCCGPMDGFGARRGGEVYCCASD